MLATEHYSVFCPDAAMPNHELLEIHRSKISLHHAKAGYDYPAIRLPFKFSGLMGLSTRIYQTVHDGALAFLVVVSSAAQPYEKRSDEKLEKAAAKRKILRLDMAEVAGSNPAEPIGFWGCFCRLGYILGINRFRRHVQRIYLI